MTNAIMGFLLCVLILGLICVLAMLLIRMAFRKEDFNDIANMEDIDND